MKQVNELLRDTRLESIQDAGLAIVSIFGNDGFRTTSAYSSGKHTNLNVTLANRIVGRQVFMPRYQVRRATIGYREPFDLYTNIDTTIMHCRGKILEEVKRHVYSYNDSLWKDYKCMWTNHLVQRISLWMLPSTHIIWQKHIVMMSR